MRRIMRNPKYLIIIAALIILVGILFWPTLYRYDHIGDRFLRTNRVTGQTQEYEDGAWNTQETKSNAVIESRYGVLPHEEIEKVKGKASISSSPFEPNAFKAELYNGSGWAITSIKVRIILREKNGTVRWDREFTASRDAMEAYLSKDSYMGWSPQSTGTFKAKINDYANFGDFSWLIVEITGNKLK
jgi:hypothetical protein